MIFPTPNQAMRPFQAIRDPWFPVVTDRQRELERLYRKQIEEIQKEEIERLKRWFWERGIDPDDPCEAFPWLPRKPHQHPLDHDHKIDRFDQKHDLLKRVIKKIPQTQQKSLLAA